MDDSLEIHIGGAEDSCFEYDVAGAIVVRPKPLHVFADKKIQYNQHKDDPRGCTWYAVMTCIANNWGVEWSKEDFNYMRTTAPSYGRVDKRGMQLSKAGDMVIDYLNKKYPQQGRYKEQIPNYQGTLLEEAIMQGYCVQMGSPINAAYTKEIKDGVINNPRGTVGTGHSRTFAPTGSFQGKVLVENFDSVLPYNVIDIADMQQLLDVRQFFNNSFIYYPTNTMPVEIPYKYITPIQADALEKKYPDLFTPNFSESVLAWEIAAKTGNMKYNYVSYEGIDGVMKMMIDLKQYRG